MPTVLVIEDDSAIQEAVTDILELEGYTVLAASDGLAGVALAREGRPHLIICDIMMPFLDGYGVLAELRRHPQTAAIPLIFLTAKTTREDFRQGMKLGADDYLPKPFTAQELLSTVRMRLERQTQLADRFQKRVEALHSSLVTVLPHELRTPLNGILGGISLLQDEFASLEPADAEELLTIVQQSALRLQRLVENCLLYAELASMAAVPASRPPSAAVTAPLLRTVQTVAAREAAAAEREGDLRFVGEEGAEHEFADLPQADLAKLVEEVLNNALRYSEAGTPVEVTVGSEGPRGSEGEGLWICVSDRGRGMSREEIAALGPFRQFQRSRYEQQGLGLGLAITQHLLTLHGGKLVIESRLGEGTTVRMMVRKA